MLLFILFFFQSKAASPFTQTVHEGWTFSYQAKSYRATVPGCIHTDLLSNNLIQYPFYRTTDSALEWIDKTDWVYENVFDASAELWNKDEKELIFYGLDTYAEVYLNDSLVLVADNMFRTWRVNCKSILRLKGNHLRIKFSSVKIMAGLLFEKTPFRLPSEHRVMVRKAQFQFGWDFSPALISCGIWRKVEIKGWDKFCIKSVSIRLDSINNKQAFLSASLHIPASQASSLTVRIREKAHADFLMNRQVQAKAGKNEFALHFVINNPVRWWCNGFGDPHLYNLIFEVTGFPDYYEETMIRYGLRTIELIENPDSSGKSFYFKLNGIPVFMKGANNVPLNIFPSAIRLSQYDSLISTALNSNFNMLRIWGGGIYEDEYFYRLCDEKGILVWQDFMFACAMYPFDSLFLMNVMQEADEQVSRLSNHPCVAIFCGNNENSEGWHKWGWQDGFSKEEKNSLWNGYRRIFNEILPHVVNSYSSLPYWESSPSYGRGDLRHTGSGDAHNWFVWHDGEPFENYESKVPRFMSEFGFQSYPSAKCLNINEDNTGSVFSSGIQAHQKHKRGNDIIKKYLKTDYWLPEKGEDFIYLSQVLQAEGIGRGIEAHRRSKPYCMGSLYWQFNDCWPAISWSSYDYAGQWKALQYFAKRAFSTFMISVQEKGDSIAIYIVSDSLTPVEADLIIGVFKFDGEKITTIDSKVQLNANEVKMVYILKSQIELNDASRFDRILDVSLRLNERLVAERIHYFGKPKELPFTEPGIKLKTTPDGNDVLISLSTTKPAKNVFLNASTSGFFSDNYFDMLPGRTYHIRFSNFSSGTFPEIKIKTIFGTR